MSYKTERDLRQMLLHQELIESSLSFVSGSEDFILENDIFPSGRTDSDVMRGLRYPNGTGVIAGVTSIGDVDGYDLADGEKIPRKGQLFYRGISIEDIIQQCIKEDRFGFEETVYLLLFGQLPTVEPASRLLHRGYDPPLSQQKHYEQAGKLHTGSPLP